MNKITPKQAFDAIKVLYPDSIGIAKTSDPKTAQLLPPNETPAYARMKFSADVEIDWGTQTQYPETVYRDATINDLKTMPEAEFSDHPAFGNTTSGKLTGYAMIGQASRWYCGFPNNPQFPTTIAVFRFPHRSQPRRKDGRLSWKNTRNAGP